MSQDKLDEILQRGMFGNKETLPEERKLFLSTISERIYLALTNKQVRKRGMYDEAKELMKKTFRRSLIYQRRTKLPCLLQLYSGC
ncbi:MAG: YueI family protein [Bacillus sp. (in: Bacteria)]|nr:YueI family protein [Bacillus sp. (in: firmicutes)]